MAFGNASQSVEKQEQPALSFRTFQAAMPKRDRSAGVKKWLHVQALDLQFSHFMNTQPNSISFLLMAHTYTVFLLATTHSWARRKGP